MLSWWIRLRRRGRTRQRTRGCRHGAVADHVLLAHHEVEQKLVWPLCREPCIRCGEKGTHRPLRIRAPGAARHTAIAAGALQPILDVENQARPDGMSHRARLQQARRRRARCRHCYGLRRPRHLLERGDPRLSREGGPRGEETGGSRTHRRGDDWSPRLREIPRCFWRSRRQPGLRDHASDTERQK